ncbi:MAG: protein kinase [Proteobacteria bacterium]|nr:protein kinase [Pseudomonadota bacterium]
MKLGDAESSATGAERPTGNEATSIDVLLPGTPLGPYQIERVLGRGGFGVTYLAQHLKIKKHFAIKEYLPVQFASRRGPSVAPTLGNRSYFDRGLARFLKEAEGLARFKHPAIVDVSDHFEANGTAYMVLAYERGTNLRNWIANLQRHPTQAELDAILKPILDAVELMHQNGALHADIAPDNIIIRPDGSPVLVDFGSWRPLPEPKADAIDGSSSKVTIVIKPGYSPPEQYTGEAAQQGTWSDIYSIAATLYFAVGGTPPTESTKRAPSRQLATARAGGEEGLRPEFLAAVDWGLALDPSKRPQTVGEWRSVLIGNGDAGAGQSVAKRSLSAGTFIGRWHLASAISVLIAGVGFLLWQANRSHSSLQSPVGTIGTGPSAGGGERKPENSIGVLSPSDVNISLAKSTFRIGDELNFTLTARKDCQFLVYTVGADDKVEVHDPATDSAFFGKPLLDAGEQRMIPVVGSTKIARIKGPAGNYEIGAVCGRDELERLGLSVDQLNEQGQRGKRSFEIVLKQASGRLNRAEIERASVPYTVVP